MTNKEIVEIIELIQAVIGVAIGICLIYLVRGIYVLRKLRREVGKK